MSDNYKQLIKEKVLDQTHFHQAIFKGQRRGEYVPWLKVVLRPVLIKDQPHLQFSYFEANKDVTKNYLGDEAIEKLDQLLGHPFKNYQVQGSAGSVHVQITKKGKAIIHQEKVALEEKTPPLAHDRSKQHLLSDTQADPFLQAAGIMGPDGKIKAAMRRKLRQINEFLKLIDDTIEPKRLTQQAPLHVVDFGCGNAYLTFATYHYLTHILGLPTHLTGVDTKVDLMEKHLANSQALGWDISFEPTSIIDFHSERPVDIVLALHACDTATDEALAQGILWQSPYIFSAPCCHHHLQQQMQQQPTPTEFRAVLRHGILRERLGDILTDSLRASILRIMGYKADVVEFVSSEHTAKNLMIRAVKSTTAGDPNFVEEYNQLKSLWQVQPYLEELLGERLTSYLDRNQQSPS